MEDRLRGPVKNAIGKSGVRDDQPARAATDAGEITKRILSMLPLTAVVAAINGQRHARHPL